MSLVSRVAFLSDAVFLNLPFLPLLGVNEACMSGSDMDLGSAALWAECAGIRAD